MIYTHKFDGLPLKSGDILCTQDGGEDSLFGQIWRMLGKILPGEIDHCVVYVGPGGYCVESTARGLYTFEMPGERWDAHPLSKERLLVDTLIGVAYPLEGRGLSATQEELVRQNVVDYCLCQAEQRKPYNVNLFDPETERAFYCSQLVYKAYLAQGIDLDPRPTDRPASALEKVVFPLEIWDACFHRRVETGENQSASSQP